MSGEKDNKTGGEKAHGTEPNGAKSVRGEKAHGTEPNGATADASAKPRRAPWRDKAAKPQGGAPQGAKGANVRALALASLVRLRADGKYANLEVAASLGRADLSDKDRALYTALVYGVVERSITLDHILAALSSRPLDALDTQTRSAAELGLYQLIYLDRVPDHAAVSETVEASPRRSRGFVNAILRSFIRSGKKQPPLPDDPLERLSVECSMPRELVSFFAAAYPDRYERIVASTLRRGRTTLRVNTLRLSAAEALDLLGEGASVGAAPDTVTVDGESAAVLDGIARGLWFVQDASSRFAAHVLGAKPGMLVADCCAAPGGKSFSMALDMEDRGDVRSFDLHENKLSLIRDGAARLGLTSISAFARDARECDETLVGRADRVLVDAPCSGLGVIAKKPDIKYKDLAESARLPEIQYAILSEASRYVKPGGVLVYSTCTLAPAENEGVFGRFLASRGDFEPLDFEIVGKRSGRGMLTLFPDEGEWDGFFIARAVRRD